ncbi:MAG: hypothetical protein ACOX1X_00100 [Dethiobacteria bacterium]
MDQPQDSTVGPVVPDGPCGWGALWLGSTGRGDGQTVPVSFGWVTENRPLSLVT